MIIRPLLNELNALNLNLDEKSPYFETIPFDFHATSLLDIESEKSPNESDALKKELDKLKADSQKNLLKTLKSQENINQFRRNSLLELDSIMNGYKSDMGVLKDEILELKKEIKRKNLDICEKNEEIDGKNSEIVRFLREIQEKEVFELKLKDLRIESSRKEALIEEVAKKLEETEAENGGIQAEIQLLKERLQETKENLSKAINFFATCEELPEDLKEIFEEKLVLVKTAFKEVESEVRDCNVRFMTVCDTVKEVRVHCMNAPKDAESIWKEIAELREENEKLKEVNAQHENERTNLLKEIEGSMVAIRDTKNKLNRVAKNLEEDFDENHAEVKE